jgi:hypothetical protein
MKIGLFLPAPIKQALADNRRYNPPRPTAPSQGLPWPDSGYNGVARRPT